MLESIDHVNLVVNDTQRVIAFYTEVLGRRLTRQFLITGPWIEAVTSLAPAEAEVAFFELGAGGENRNDPLPQARGPIGSDNGEPPNVAGFRHMAFRVSKMEQFGAAIKESGCPMLSDIQQVPASQVDFAQQTKYLAYFRDPEGNLLGLCEFR